MFATGEYVTRGEIQAKILLIDLNANYPLIGAIMCEHGWWVTACWDSRGRLHDPDEEFEQLYDEEEDEVYNAGDLKANE